MKRCSTCNRTYADETLTFCLADGALLSAPYDPQATEILPTLPETIPSPPPVWPPHQSPTPQPQGTRNRVLYVVLALFFLVIGVTVTVLWTQRNPTGPSAGVNPNTVSSPKAAPEQSNEALSKPSPDLPSPATQQPTVAVQAPTATKAQTSDDVPVRFSLDRSDPDYPYNVARTDYFAEGGSAPILSLGSGEVSLIWAKPGAKYNSGEIMIRVRAQITVVQVSTRESPLPPTKTEDLDVFVKPKVRLEIVKVLVRTGQIVHPNDVLMIVRRN